MSKQPQMPQEFDSKNQAEKCLASCVAGEQLYAVFDLKGAGTGFIGISDLRLIFIDQAFTRKTRHLVSIPYSKISIVASDDSGKILFATSMLSVVAGDRQFDFEFHSNEKAHRAYELIMWNVLQNERKGMMAGAR